LLESARRRHPERSSLLTELVEDAARDCRYLVVVAASDEPLYRYLQMRLDADAAARVILDRRRRGAPAGGAGRRAPERRVSRAVDLLSSQRVVVIRLAADASVSGTTVNRTAGQGGPPTMEGMEGMEDRQRLDRWLEESQYLMGRIIPAYLDDRERVRGRVAAAEQDGERLRAELAEARREIAELRADLELHRAERAGVADTFNTIVEHLAALQKPVNDISRRLHAAQPAASELKI
jgi:hypothetical protein